MDENNVNDAAEMAIKIHEAIYNADPKLIKWSPDGLVKVLVNLAKLNDWNRKKLELETINAIKYYFERDFTI